MSQTFRYDIRNSEILNYLLNQGFSLLNTSPGIWTVEAPANISSTKARRLISIYIKLHIAGKECTRAKRKYESLVNQINNLNLVL